MGIVWPKDEFTRFEVARIVGARSLQIALGAPVLVKTDKTDFIEIAKDEFRNKMIPITVKRTMPDGAKVAVEAKNAIQNWIERYNGVI